MSVVPLLVVSFALIAAFLYTLSDYLEQRAARRAALNGALHRMVRDRQWVLGWSIGTVAIFVQAAALRLGSVTVVQSLQLTTLLFTLRLSTLGTRQRPSWRDYGGALAVCAGLATFLTLRGDPASSGAAPDRSRIALLLVLMGFVVLVLVAVARGTTGTPRATALALAAGVALGCGATLVKLTTTDLTNRGVPATAADWPGYALAASTGAGLVLQQIAFASGRLPTATTAMVVVNPLVGSAIAVEGFHEHLPHSAGRLTGIALAATLLVVGVAVLAHSPLVRGETEEPPIEPVPPTEPWRIRYPAQPC